VAQTESPGIDFEMVRLLAGSQATCTDISTVNNDSKDDATADYRRAVARESPSSTLVCADSVLPRVKVGESAARFIS